MIATRSRVSPSCAVSSGLLHSLLVEPRRWLRGVMSHTAALSQNFCPRTPLSPESRERLLRTVHSALGLLQYYEGSAEPTRGIRAVLLNRLLEAVAELDALGHNTGSPNR
jgi:hypothetical protein